MMDNPQGDGKSRHASPKSTITILKSKRRYASARAWGQGQRGRTIGIGLNPSFSIHLWVWRECGALGELCKYGLDLSGKVYNTTLETNKQDLNSNFPPKLIWLFLKYLSSDDDLTNPNSF
jgi:hypothetical protein